MTGEMMVGAVVVTMLAVAIAAAWRGEPGD